MTIKQFLLFFFCFLSFSLNAQDLVKIESDKVVSLIHFLEATKNNYTSGSYQNYVHGELMKMEDKDKEELQKIINKYDNIVTDYWIEKNEYPLIRASSRRYLFDILIIIASNSKDLSDFSERIIGLLPHQTHTEYIKVLREAESFHDKLIWKKNQEDTSQAISKISEYKKQMEDIYLKASQFYGTDWNREIPFKVILIPTPFMKGGTKAHAHGNVLISEFITQQTNDYKVRLGVILHEMCHILYEEQPWRLQNEIEKWFKSSNSAYKNYAYYYFDEAMATAIGNGYGYEKINKKLDEQSWYNNPYIEGFAKAIYPLTKDYLEEGKQIDSAYVVKSIKLFEEAFPKALLDPHTLLKEVQIISDFDEPKAVKNMLRSVFRVYSVYGDFGTAKGIPFTEFIPFTTKVFVIKSDDKKLLDSIKKHYQIDFGYQPNGIYIFEDEKSKSTIFLFTSSDLDALEKALKKLANQKEITHKKWTTIK